MMKWEPFEIHLVAPVAIASFAFAVHCMAASIKGVVIGRAMPSALGLTATGNSVYLHSMKRTK